MDFIIKKYCKLFIVLWITSKTIAKSKIINRCVLVPPRCPSRNVNFFLYTRATKDNPTQLDMFKQNDIITTQYIKDRPLIILIHGYTGHHNYPPNVIIRTAFFKEDDYNIISVDYEPLAKEPCYAQAVENLPTVSNCTAELLDLLVDWNIFKLESIHVIGFSLGAQGSGIIANYLKKGRKLKRITGLDPAKPMFILVSDQHRLDQNDAEFVDIVHTDVFERGVLLPSGHVDFYANGGFNQPGCLNLSNPSSCNHGRAPEYYAESISSKNEKLFWGFKCAHWYLYAIGMCREEESNALAEMGYNVSTSSRGLYFLTTNRDSPYARGSNFTTNTVLPAENLETELDQEIDGENATV